MFCIVYHIQCFCAIVLAISVPPNFAFKKIMPTLSHKNTIHLSSSSHLMALIHSPLRAKKTLCWLRPRSGPKMASWKEQLNPNTKPQNIPKPSKALNPSKPKPPKNRPRSTSVRLLPGRSHRWWCSPVGKQRGRPCKFWVRSRELRGVWRNGGERKYRCLVPHYTLIVCLEYLQNCNMLVPSVKIGPR